MKILLLFFSTLLLCRLTNAQSHKFEWAHNTGAHFVYSVATDKDGNVYTCGKFNYTVDFDPGPGTSTLTSVSPNHDLFLSKCDKNGNFVWAKQMGGMD